MRYKEYIIIIVVVFFLNACATYQPQYKNNNDTNTFPQNKDIKHSFYLIGDAGNSLTGEKANALQQLENALKEAPKNSTLLFLGDNVYPSGLPDKDNHNRAFAEHQLNTQVSIAKDFKGKTIFIPGNHDWYSDGVKGLKRQEKFIENALGKNTFLPENGCPLEKVEISEDIVMIIIDSQWYLTNWDKHPTINDNCEIKTRDKFFEEFESLVKKARGKTTIIALHHPMFTNGPHGGQFSFAQHLTPAPVLGTLKNVIRKTGGVSSADLQNVKYKELRKRIITLTQENDKAIFVSGHEHSLQYIVQDNLPQIVSGSGSKTNATRNAGGGQFSYGAEGYARLDVFTDGSSYVRFYKADGNELVYQTEVLSKQQQEVVSKYNSQIPDTKISSVYPFKAAKKTDAYKALWGERYREDYSAQITAPTVSLDTLFGGLTPIRKGGGHQSKSLRLENKNGQEYVMRAVRKNALQYLQAVVFKEQYIEGQFNNTFTEELLLDLFTGAYPYAPLAVGALANAAGVYHTNPTLYFVPKQNILGTFNDEFGDELYMIEERAADGHGDNASFGFSDELISTNDMIDNLRKDEKYQVDEASYIRARLFDMLIGDWDRHQDQWRWATFKKDEKVIYKPVPRDRDQAFSIMTDGSMLGIATTLIPGSRLLRSYSDDIKSVKWFNTEPLPMDIMFINESNRAVWDAQVKQITTNITDAVIEDAFNVLPKELDKTTIEIIKTKLKGRRANLQKISNEYYDFINRYAIVNGTDKDDWFDIERLANGDTKISGYRIKNGEKGTLFHQRTYHKKETKKIWIYGLDDDDMFKVWGNVNKVIPIRIVGGQNNDTYDVQNGKAVRLYDYKSKKNTFLTNKGIKKLTDDYETNVFNYRKISTRVNQFIPTLGANPDDGFRIGFIDTYTINNFERNPFSAKHQIAASYYFATSGFDVSYKGEFAKVIGGLNLGFEASYTSPNYSINFFGFGNSTLNLEPDDLVDLDFNRVRIRNVSFAPSLIWRAPAANLKFGVTYEAIEVQRTEDRFIEAFAGNRQEVDANFLGTEATYEFENNDNSAFPTLGMHFNLTAGYKNNIDKRESFGYIIPSLSVDYKLVPNGRLVLASKIKGHINIGDDFKFYQAASIGGNDGLRGYRNQRFTGKRAFYQSSDLRFNLRKVKTGLLPVNIGIYGGFDYGRVWINNRLVDDVSFNSDTWNTSVGGGVFINGANKITSNISVFNSDDELRVAFALGFGF